MKRATVSGLIAALILTGIIAGCGGGGSSTGTTGTTAKSGNSYAGPGSSWTFDLFDDGTFEATETDANPDLSVSGTWSTTDSGFKKLTVTTTSDAGAVTVGSTGYAVDIPGWFPSSSLLTAPRSFLR